MARRVIGLPATMPLAVICRNSRRLGTVRGEDTPYPSSMHVATLIHCNFSWGALPAHFFCPTDCRQGLDDPRTVQRIAAR